MRTNLVGVVRPTTTMPANAQGVNLSLFNPDGSPFAGADGGGISQGDLDDALETKQDAAEFLTALVTLGPPPSEGTFQLTATDGVLSWEEAV